MIHVSEFKWMEKKKEMREEDPHAVFTFPFHTCVSGPLIHLSSRPHHHQQPSSLSNGPF